MKEILVAVMVSAVVSSAMTLILIKAIAANHFKVIDSYVKDMVEIAKEQIRLAYIRQDRQI